MSTNKILFCATVDYHFRAFHLPTLQWFKSQNWEVHVAANGDMDLPFVDQKYNLSIQRSPLHPGNLQAYRQLKRIMRENDYRLIHCHTPMGGVLARLAARASRKHGTKLLYTAHGFHFCEGAPLLNWLLYYPVEKQLSRLTDCLITINREDYDLARSRNFRAGQITRINGVGVDLTRYRPVGAQERRMLRQKHHFGTEDLLLFYAAEFNKNKNHALLIQAMAQLKQQVPHARLLLAGAGPLHNYCRQLADELGVSAMVSFLGYRSDIAELLPMCDAAVASSLREGLPVNVMEAMACGLPIVATRNRGHVELVSDERNGYIITPRSSSLFARRLQQLAASEELRARMGRESLVMVKRYASAQVAEQLSSIYIPHMKDEENEMERLHWATQ